MLSQFLSVSLAQSGVQIQIGNNFTGSDNTESGITPADGNGAIGPKHYVEFINGEVAIYAKTNGQRVQRISDSQFWANAGVVISSDASISDPRVIYDPDVATLVCVAGGLQFHRERSHHVGE